MQVIDYGKWHLLLDANFATPSVDQDGPLSFGTILACVNMCLKLLVKVCVQYLLFYTLSRYVKLVIV